jgi:hypothetical protein
MVGYLRVTGEIQKGKYKGKLVRLDTSFPDDPEIKEIASQYSTRLKDYYARPESRTNVAPRATQLSYKFTGAIQCRGCHTDVFNRWRETRHAHAMTSLVKKEKQAESSCVRCHSTGFQRPSGFISLEVTPDLADVQCEQCHGPGSLHILYQKTGEAGLVDMSVATIENTKGYGNVSTSVCLHCHTPERDDDFSYTRGDLTGIH